MNKTKFIRVFSKTLIIILVICFVQNTFAQKDFRLGFVKKFDDSFDQIWLADTKKKDLVDSKTVAVFSAGLTGRININGRDIELKSVKQYLPDRNFKVGRGGYQIYKGVGVIVRLDYIFTWVCPPNDEQCETYEYKGVLSIDFKRNRRRVEVIGFGGS